MNRVVRLLAAAFAAIALTTGCSMIPGMGGQSGVQACSSISGTIQDATSKLASALTEVANDPQAASKAVREFVDTLSAARGKVTNAGVGAALDKAIASGTKLVDLLAKADAASLDSAKVSELMAEIQTALTDLVKACSKI